MVRAERDDQRRDVVRRGHVPREGADVGARPERRVVRVDARGAPGVEQAVGEDDVRRREGAAPAPEVAVEPGGPGVGRRRVAVEPRARRAARAPDPRGPDEVLERRAGRDVRRPVEVAADALDEVVDEVQVVVAAHGVPGAAVVGPRARAPGPRRGRQPPPPARRAAAEGEARLRARDLRRRVRRALRKRGRRGVARCTTSPRRPGRPGRRRARPRPSRRRRSRAPRRRRRRRPRPSGGSPRPR